MKRKEESSTSLCAVGVIAKVFGVKGEVKIHSYSRSLEEYEGLDSILVGKSEEKAVEMSIEDVVPRGNHIYIKFRDISDRTASQLLIGHFLFVEERERKRLASGEYFVNDLLGITVYGKDNKKLGVLKEVVHYPAHDVYVVHTGGTEVMVPAVKKIVLAVDVKNRTMTLDPPAGLFDGENL